MPPEAPSKADSLDEQIVRRILCSVEDNAQLSQRQLSAELGIALGSVNWYLKRCINKGLIKIGQAPLRRYMYYLTPQGFEEKSRLMGQYLKWSLDFFRLGRRESASILERCAERGVTSVILAGDSDLAEIFILSAMDMPVTVAAIFDPHSPHDKRLGVPVVKNAPAGAFYILTDSAAPRVTWDALRAQSIAAESIVIPDLLSFQPMLKEPA